MTGKQHFLGHKHTERARAAISAGMTGKQNGLGNQSALGYKHTEEQCAARSGELLPSGCLTPVGTINQWTILLSPYCCNPVDLAEKCVVFVISFYDFFPNRLKTFLQQLS